MSRGNGQVEVDRRRMVWELIRRPSVSMQQKCGGQEGIVCTGAGVGTDERGRRLLEASNTVAGVVVQGDLWWKKLEEKSEGMKVVFGKRLEGIEESRLVKMVMAKLREDGGIG